MRKKFNKRLLKKTPEELELYLHFKRRGSKVPPKKGKGSFQRKKKRNRDDF